MQNFMLRLLASTRKFYDQPFRSYERKTLSLHIRLNFVHLQLYYQSGKGNEKEICFWH